MCLGWYWDVVDVFGVAMCGGGFFLGGSGQ